MFKHQDKLSDRDRKIVQHIIHYLVKDKNLSMCTQNCADEDMKYMDEIYKDIKKRKGL